ncbi:serine/threonine-protein phosphatase 4 regulatory subunit 1 [Copidosoma floridanum]|uniref:serine/threonine-protein phosphatase 4 regulatory subunit 1 n=1 Tax=Copidosoma floridanum TaxID=29053 RepID=UPI0006C9E35A|nr:serine/threonine-protein phosphatase 4 regulatory subunit 1 [Copidosoma floridanum]
MADISYFQNDELEEDPNDEMEEEYNKDAYDKNYDENYGKDYESAYESADVVVTNMQRDPRLLEDDGVIRLEEHVTSNTSCERQVVGEILLGIFQNAVKSKTVVNVSRVFEPLKHIIHDPEAAVKSTLVVCLPNILVLYQEVPRVFSESPTRRVLNIVTGYLHDSETQVRQDALGVIKTLLDRELLDEESIEQDLCKTIIDLSCHVSYDLQSLALSLMTRVNPFIGDELTEKLFLDRFLDLCTSDAFLVRRVCASIVGEFCTILSKEAIYNKLLRAYSKLCMDAVWSVRKTTVDVMMSVVRCVPLSMRRHLLSKLLVQHLRDESRWVRRSAYEILGPFISTFAKQFNELICDQKGELVLVHENERGWPRFNVVPVAKFSDILSENLNFNSKLRDSSIEERSWATLQAQTRNKADMYIPGDPYDVILKNKISQMKDYENFNTFKYYYNPPDTPLDMDFVKSIISEDSGTSDNDIANDDNSTNTDENISSNDDVKNYPISNGWATYDGVQDNENNTENNSEQQPQNQKIQLSDDNENNVNYKQEQEHQQQQNTDSNDNNDNENNEPKVRLQMYENEENRDENSDDEDYTSREQRKTRRNRCTSDIRCGILNNTFDVSFSEQGSSSNNARSYDSSLEFYDSDWEDDDNDIVPGILVRYYIKMAWNQSNSNEGGPGLDYHCAFSFPAVVLTLGKENWPKLKDAYQSLAGAVTWKVRSTLASSIHEIATIIGKEYTASDLVPIFNGFIKDLDEVMIGALKHFGTFLNVLSPQDRTQYLSKLNDFLVTDSKWNWRLREELVKQLSFIIKLYQSMDVAQYIAPLLLHLMQDRVAAVRQEAIHAVATTISYLDSHSDDALAIAMLREMRNLLKSHATERWMIRQTYALVCQKLIENTIVTGEVFARELLPYLFELSYDRVPNVRLVVARTFSELVYQMPTYFDTELMNEVRQKLKDMQKDADRDVRMFASELSDKFF